METVCLAKWDFFSITKATKVLFHLLRLVKIYRVSQFTCSCFPGFRDINSFTNNYEPCRSAQKTLWLQKKILVISSFPVYHNILGISTIFIIPPPPTHTHNEVEGVYWNRHGCPSVCPFVRPSVFPWIQFCPELFSYSFARTALKFIHNVCVHMKLCMCNIHDHTIIGCGIIFP